MTGGTGLYNYPKTPISSTNQLLRSLFATHQKKTCKNHAVTQVIHVTNTPPNTSETKYVPTPNTTTTPFPTTPAIRRKKEKAKTTNPPKPHHHYKSP